VQTGIRKTLSGGRESLKSEVPLLLSLGNAVGARRKKNELRAARRRLRQASSIQGEKSFDHIQHADKKISKDTRRRGKTKDLGKGATSKQREGEILQDSRSPKKNVTTRGGMQCGEQNCPLGENPPPHG